MFYCPVNAFQKYQKEKNEIPLWVEENRPTEASHHNKAKKDGYQGKLNPKQVSGEVEEILENSEAIWLFCNLRICHMDSKVKGCTKDKVDLIPAVAIPVQWRPFGFALYPSYKALKLKQLHHDWSSELTKRLDKILKKYSCIYHEITRFAAADTSQVL